MTLNKDMAKIYTSMEVIKETVKRIELQNNKDHNEIKARQDKTNGSIQHHDNRIQRVEDIQSGCKERLKREANVGMFKTDKNLKIIGIILVILQFAFNLFVALKVG